MQSEKEAVRKWLVHTLHSAYHPSPGDPVTWLQAASAFRVRIGAICGAIAGVASACLGLADLLASGDTFGWWLLAWGGLTLLAAVGVQLRVEIARPVAGVLLGLAAVLAAGADLLSGLPLNFPDIWATVGLGLVALSGAIGFIALGLTMYAIEMLLSALLRR